MPFSTAQLLRRLHMQHPRAVLPTAVHRRRTGIRRILRASLMKKYDAAVEHAYGYHIACVNTVRASLSRAATSPHVYANHPLTVLTVYRTHHLNQAP